MMYKRFYSIIPCGVLVLSAAISTQAEVQPSINNTVLTRSEGITTVALRPKFDFGCFLQPTRGLPAGCRVATVRSNVFQSTFNLNLAPPDLPVFGNGSTGRIPKWTGMGEGNKWLIHDSNIFEDNQGRIGIGTTSPSSLFTVAGMIESRSGGYKFPDGTVQITAAAGFSLFHNATLMGDGTAASPLGVAVPLFLRGSATQPILNVQNDGFGFAIQGVGIGQNGLAGFSNTADGTSGQTNGASHSGVFGVNTNAAGWGVRGTNSGNGAYGYLGGPAGGAFGFSPGAAGVSGESTTGDGVSGQTGGGGKSGVYGFNTNTSGFGVFGRNTATGEVGYLAGTGNGVYGFSSAGNGVLGQSTTGLAGDFLGNVSITGNTGIGVLPSTARLSVGGLIQSTTGGYQFPDGTTQTTAATSGLTAVAHDSTLTGNGTAASPLGVVSSGLYINNSTSEQPDSNFNISGDGTAAGTLQGGVVTAEAFFKIGSHRMVSLDPSAPNVDSTTSTFVGISAGEGNGNINADRNSFFGRESGRNNNGTGNTFLGYQSGLNNVGNPTFLAGSRNTFVGYRSGVNNGTSGAIPAGNYNTFLGDIAGNANVDGNNNTVIGAGADLGSSDLEYATAVGSGAVVSSSSTVELGRNDGSDMVDVPGKLQIDTLAVAGSTQLCLNAANRVSNCSSSMRYKTAIRPFAGGLDVINRLNPITFTWKTDAKRDLGLGAEDVAKIEPLLITHNAAGEIEGVKYDRLNVVLINAIKQQQEQIDKLKKLVCMDHPTAGVCK